MKSEWTTHIKPNKGWNSINLKELLASLDLIKVLVKKTFVTMYKQTLLGPAWIIIMPILSTLSLTVIFGTVAQLPTEGVPKFLFYMSGNTLWMYFASVLSVGVDAFSANASLFGKVYFPRLAAPIASTISQLIQYFIRLSIFAVIMVIYIIIGSPVRPNIYLLAFPLLLLILTMLGLGIGFIISSLTTKYRDLRVFIDFALQLWMYASPIVYPFSQVPDYLKNILLLNPITPVVEALRFALFGVGEFNVLFLIISALFSFVIFFAGIMMFSKVEKTFVDTI